MQSASDWWSQCAFVRDYFFGSEQKVAHQVAECLKNSITFEQLVRQVVQMRQAV